MRRTHHRSKSNGHKQQQLLLKQKTNGFSTYLKTLKKKPLKAIGIVTVSAAGLLSGLIFYKMKNAKPSLYKKWIG